ncbi:unnamed protein product, partial [Oikopleura dioica]
ALFPAERAGSSWIYHRIMSLLIALSKMRRCGPLQNRISF